MVFTSIIIPTYNRAHLIRETIESAIRQTSRDIEIVVVDDGSTDRTKEVLQDYINAGSIVYIWQENAGRSEARNHGARIAKGGFFLFLDSDDLLDPKAIENLKQLSLDNPQSDIYSGKVIFFSDDGKSWNAHRFNYSENYADKQVISEVAGDIFLSIGAYMVRKDIFFKDTGFVKEFEPAEDVDFSIKTLYAGLFSWSKDFVVVNKRRHTGNTGDKDLYEASSTICRYYIRQIKAGKLPNFNKERSKLLSNLYERLLTDCINLNKKWTGTRYFGRMIIANSTKLFSPVKWKLWLYLLFFSGRKKSGSSR